MSSRDRLGGVSVVTDDDSGMEKIGDTCLGWDDERLEQFFRSHGEKGFSSLSESMCNGIHNMTKIWRKVRDEVKGPESVQASRPGGLTSQRPW